MSETTDMEAAKEIRRLQELLRQLEDRVSAADRWEQRFDQLLTIWLQHSGHHESDYP